MEIDIIILIWLHFLSDFLLQSDEMAINKSKSNKILALHCLVYSIPFLWFGWMFAAVNGVLHFFTDWVSSRAASHFHQKGERRRFFLVIGADQAVHMTTLVLTLHYLTNP